MSFEIIVSERAEEEILDAHNWYEKEVPGLGIRYVNHVDSLLETIKGNPYLFPIKYKNYHQVPMKVFPFIIIYLIEGNEVVIESVFHTSQDPKKKYFN